MIPFPFSFMSSGGLLLDKYPGAAFAYSLRKLNSSYTGNCMTVRNTTSGVLTDIPFSGNYIDLSSLNAASVGAAELRVSTWYDQSGNNRNAVSPSTGTQLRIHNGGVLETNQLGIPSLRAFNSPATRMGVSSWVVDATNITTFALSSSLTASQQVAFCVMADAGTSRRWYTPITTTTNEARLGWAGSTSIASTAVSDVTVPRIYNAISDTTNTNRMYYYVNNVEKYNVAFPASQLGKMTMFITLGNSLYASSNSPWNGYITEAFGWDSPKVNEREAILNNMNNYYGIY